MNRNDFAVLKDLPTEKVVARMRSFGWMTAPNGTWERKLTHETGRVRIPWPFFGDVTDYASIHEFVRDVSHIEGIGEADFIHSLTGDPAPLKAHAEWLLLTTKQRDEVCDYLATEWESLLDDATSTRAERRSAHAVATARDLLIALSESPE